MNTPAHTPPRAFTLIELLTVIAIIGILAGIILPVVSRVRETARGASCVSNLRQLQAAAMLWINENRDQMPDARAWSYAEDNTSSTAYPYQLCNYLNFKVKKTSNIDWAKTPSPMKCDPGHKAFPGATDGSTPFGRTYAINAYATATMASTGSSVTIDKRDPKWGYALRLTQITHPSRMVFFTDGAVSNAGSYTSNLSATYVPDAATTPIRYVHRDSINVVFVDGHVQRISKADMQAKYADNENSFWRYDK